MPGIIAIGRCGIGGGRRRPPERSSRSTRNKHDGLSGHFGKYKTAETHLPRRRRPTGRVFRIGACPNVTDLRQRDSRVRGSPHDDRKTREIRSSARPDIQKGRILVTGLQAIPEGGGIEATPTASVPKRGPDRKLTSKTRAISDMRRANLGLSKYDVSMFQFRRYRRL